MAGAGRKGRTAGLLRKELGPVAAVAAFGWPANAWVVLDTSKYVIGRVRMGKLVRICKPAVNQPSAAGKSSWRPQVMSHERRFQEALQDVLCVFRA